MNKEVTFQANNACLSKMKIHEVTTCTFVFDLEEIGMYVPNWLDWTTWYRSSISKNKKRTTCRSFARSVDFTLFYIFYQRYNKKTLISKSSCYSC